MRKFYRKTIEKYNKNINEKHNKNCFVYIFLEFFFTIKI